jgi:tRNA-2-methylthio-N6-dimethylallyladenosine synthase
MNLRDSELVSGLLLRRGYVLAESENAADIILFNTCSVRQHAEDRVWSEIGRYGRRRKPQAAGRRKKTGACSLEPAAKRPIVGLLGCMAENYQQAAFVKCPGLDLVAGPNNIDVIPRLLDDLLAGYPKALAVGSPQRDRTVYNTDYIAEKSHCNVNIMEGCNNFCTYCIVPYVRGRERSRPAEDIITELRAMTAKGVKNVTLLGQNVNSYRSYRIADGRRQIIETNRGLSTVETVDFIELLRRVNEIEGLDKFEFVTSHPKDAGPELFKAMAELSKCGKFLHLPVQSGSDRILKAMNRGYTRKHYLELVKQARNIIPGLRLTTDLMVGFPGETEADFQDTFALMKEVKFDAAYIFKYSPRPHTQAAKLADDVPVEVKKERNQILLEYQRSLHKKKIADGK